MARGNHINLSFDGMQILSERLKSLNGDLEATAEKALKKSHEHVTPKLHEAMRPHKRTGNTEKSIIDNAKVTWQGTTVSAGIGFDLKNGGMPSIFLMRGTPRTSPDRKLRDAIYSTKTQRKIQEIQEKVLSDAINEKMGRR